MNLDDEELLVTKHKRKLISYTKQVASGKLDKNFYNAYCELYDLLCEYMNAYNRECKDYEQTIDELYETQKRWKSKYFEEEGKVVKLVHYIALNENKLDTEVLNEFFKPKVTEQELKDMIIGMLE